MIHLVTFATDNMMRSAELCVQSARRHGVLMATGMSYDAMKAYAFYEDNRGLLDNPKGAGFWAWKPWLILAHMQAGLSADGDILIYSDAGVEFINNVSHIIERMDQDIFLFGNNWEHAHWCKRDVIEEVWDVPALDNPYYDYSPRTGGAVEREANGDLSWGEFGKQAQASVIFFRVSDYTRAFVKEWLDWCLFEGGRLIDDSPSRLPNHPEFQEHRHDQAILTTMAYREGIKLHWWPAIYNGGQFTYEKLPEYAGDTYPAIFHHHRRRNNEWQTAA